MMRFEGYNDTPKTQKNRLIIMLWPRTLSVEDNMVASLFSRHRQRREVQQRSKVCDPMI